MLHSKKSIKLKNKTTGAIGGNDIQTNEGRISLFWFPHSNRPSTRVMTLAPCNEHQHWSPANDERLTGRGGCTATENQKIWGPAKSSFSIKLCIMSIRMLHVCFDTSNVSCYPVSWRWLWDATYLISKKSNHNVVWEARTLQSNQSMVPTDQSHSLDRSLGKAPDSGGDVFWKLVTGLCVVCCLDAVFSGTIRLGKKKNPFNFPLPALFSQFLDACRWRKWWRHPASNLFQSVPITAPRNCDSPGKPLGILRHHETWS